MTLPPYARLIGMLRRKNDLESIGSLLGWDEETMMPDGGAPLRAAQHAALAAAVHRLGVAPELGDLIAELRASPDAADPEAGAVLAQAEKTWRESVALPEELVMRRARLGSEACHAWRHAREARDFQKFRPFLEAQVETVREVAAHLGYEKNPYDWCVDRHDPGVDEAFLGNIFGELRAGLAPLAGEILARRASEPEPPAGEPLRDEAGQAALCREITARMGFDYARGRLDRSAHPFCAGGALDCRLTTRFDPHDPLDALFSSVHEAGHGLYAQGLDPEHAGDALGMDAGMAVHESQSRLWENQVARSAAFWRGTAAAVEKHLPGRAAWHGATTLARRASRVRRTPVRVEADEVTYNQHILLRFELERRLLDRSLAVRDLPDAWRELSLPLLGLEPRHDGEGALQDIHWSWGEFGYFPSYTLGNMMAAALWEKFRAGSPEWERDFERGDFAPLLAFLRERVHRHGRRFDTRELHRRAVGADFSPAPLLAHLRERYA